jgi:hypothetical protein
MCTVCMPHDGASRFFQGPRDQNRCATPTWKHVHGIKTHRNCTHVRPSLRGLTHACIITLSLACPSPPQQNKTPKQLCQTLFEFNRFDCGPKFQSSNSAGRLLMQKIQGRPDSELVAAHYCGSLQVLRLLGSLGWSLTDLDTVPYGFAVPVHEALQLLRDSPPSGTCPLILTLPQQTWFLAGKMALLV